MTTELASRYASVQAPHSSSAYVQGKYSLPHFSSKAHVMDYVEEKHRDMIGIYPAVACFYTNLIEYMPPRRASIVRIPQNILAGSTCHRKSAMGSPELQFCSASVLPVVISASMARVCCPYLDDSIMADGLSSGCSDAR